MKAQSDAYPPGGFRQIVKNMQSRIFHKNCRHMPSIKETSFINFCLLGIGMEWYTKDGNNHLKIPPKTKIWLSISICIDILHVPGLFGRHLLWQSSNVSKLFSFPPHPP
jgi:hypothetical protein